MAVSLPSDIVMDVANAVDRLGLHKAHAQLAAKSRSIAASDGGLFQALSQKPETAPAGAAGASGPPAGAGQAGTVGERFESMIMQVMLQSMLPSDMEQVYGSGLAGDMWKSMLAEKIAQSMARHGQLGLANSLLKDVVMQGEQQVALAGVTDMKNVLPKQRESDISNARLLELQRSVLNANDETEDDFSLQRLQTR